jgi:acetyltransferase-like isoleucine patch superfamily enzyme
MTTANRWTRLRRWINKRQHTPRTIAAYLRQLGADVGEACFITPTDIETQIEPRLLKIGNHVAIAARVSFAAHDAERWIGSPDSIVAERELPIVIHDNCFIGCGSVLYPGVTIGPNSIVGAGSVVMSDVPPNTLVMGAPARPFGSIDRYRDKCIGRWAQQRPPDAVIESGETWWSAKQMSFNRELLRHRLLAIFADRLRQDEPHPPESAARKGA